MSLLPPEYFPSYTKLPSVSPSGHVNLQLAGESCVQLAQLVWFLLIYFLNVENAEK